ncbi:hypothetical protein [Pseudomonas phage 22PfluR64PP]|uniref:Uncharacterized protein n=1 Tax=Pseudomonas phage 22PfluR64PP TaxID=2163970 RepID=A0A2S1PDJ7_9CAUD|nr:hypothetical protein HOT19_gp46 [Pseudomonas phage 22PfluR64PP]AWH14625.1 hypothetical protein [Pseudomonas phage 22PfluR64PP]
MKTSLNYTSFVNGHTAVKILAAMQEVKATGEVVRVKNRRGQDFLLVTIAKDSLGYFFKLLDTENNCVNHMVQRASNQWSYSVQQAVWSLFSWANDLTEHPLITKARQDAFVERAKDQGATHAIRLLGGAVMYGGYQRDWLGRKRLYVLADARGRMYGLAKKLTKEACAMVSHVEELA